MLLTVGRLTDAEIMLYEKELICIVVTSASWSGKRSVKLIALCRRDFSRAYVVNDNIRINLTKV